jgi:hypothetical protein
MNFLVNLSFSPVVKTAGEPKDFSITILADNVLLKTLSASSETSFVH